MKTGSILSIIIAVGLLAGCATTSEKNYSSVLEGMSRNNLRFYFGEPLRIDQKAGGGEDWYYRFSKWHAEPTGASGTTDDFGPHTSYVEVGVGISRNVAELPVHLSPDGFVIKPVPNGRVVKN